MRLDSKSMTSEASDCTHVVDDSDPEDLDEWDEGRDHELEKKKERLIRRLIRLVGQDDGQKPFNVAIIGPMGVGKSSFVNTVAAALSRERWREYAYTGSHGGEGSPITVFTTSYPKCCVAENAWYANVHLPKFVDFAGFNDEDGENWVELLRIVFYGRLPEGESLAEAVQYLSDEGLKGLIKKYSSNNEMLKIDRIIFVSASTTPVPTKLINAVITAARPSGSSQNPMRRTIPIFGVMTKEDKVGGEEISQCDFVKREQDFINALGLAGSKHRYLRCRNYCDDVDPEQKRTMTLLPDLDIPALKFMMQVMRLDSKSMTSEDSDCTHVVDDSDPEDLDEWDEGRDHELEKKKERLIRRLIRLVGQDDGQKPLNLAIIGPMGVGKSSFVKTMAAALSGERWREYAYTGSHGGEGSQITVFTTSYPKCCVAKNTRYANVHLPKFVDISGFNDEDGENWVELLRIVFYGRLPEGESLAEAVQCLSDEGLKGLIKKYSSNNEMLKIDRVIFVSASTTPVPTKLINAVITAARPSGSSKNPMRRTIPIFGVMTKEDKVGGEEISQCDFVKREQDFINALGLAGSKHRYLRCRNYCDDVDPEQKRTMTLLPDLDIPALKFMMQVFDPAFQVGNKEENYSDLKRTSPKGSDCQAKEGDNSTRHSTAYGGDSSPNVKPASGRRGCSIQ